MIWVMKSQKSRQFDDVKDEVTEASDFCKNCLQDKPFGFICKTENCHRRSHE